MDMLIKRMTAQHTAQIADLESRCFSLPWSEASIQDELDNPLSCWLVAEDFQGKVMGYIGSQSVLGEADMMNLAVEPSLRRTGIGKLLVTSLIEALRTQNVHSLTLEVRVSNQPARSLYDNLGFVEVGRRPRYYTKPVEDAWILRKEWNCL